MQARPDVVLQELKGQKEGRSFLTDEVVAAQSSIRRLCDQEKRLIRLFGMGHVTEGYVMSEIEQIKKTRQRLENTLLELKEQQEQMEKLDSVGETIKDFCGRVEERLSQFNFEEKRLALQALQIRAVVNRDIANLYGAIPTKSATIERTSA